MGAPAAVRVHDDLASGEAGVGLGAADDELAGGVEVVDGVLVEELGGHHRLHHVLHQVLAQLLDGHVGRVLAADDDGVDAQGHARALLDRVLHRHLCIGRMRRRDKCQNS